MKKIFSAISAAFISNAEQKPMISLPGLLPRRPMLKKQQNDQETYDRYWFLAGIGTGRCAKQHRQTRGACHFNVMGLYFSCFRYGETAEELSETSGHHFQIIPVSLTASTILWKKNNKGVNSK